MNYQNDFLINVSALYRFTQKYFDRHMAGFNLGSGQLVFLLLVNEHEGITMQQLSVYADIDKGTTTKSIKRLVDEGYVEIRSDDSDKRIKRIYSLKKARDIINELYALRNEFTSQVMKNLGDEEAEKQVADLHRMVVNAREVVPDESYAQIKLGGIQKLTLLDYPGKVACTVFTAGCNMRCPFCHNKDLVFIPDNFTYTDPDDILDFLSKRQGILDAVAITGGEPLLQPGLLDFVKQIKELGYMVKVDTNGLMPDKLKQLVESSCVDYIAMDIKNSFDKYEATAGLVNGENMVRQIKKSINYLLSDVVDYEFRTTVVRELHTKEDLVSIARYIKNAKAYYLQQFEIACEHKIYFSVFDALLCLCWDGKKQVYLGRGKNKFKDNILTFLKGYVAYITKNSKEPYVIGLRRLAKEFLFDWTSIKKDIENSDSHKLKELYQEIINN